VSDRTEPTNSGDAPNGELSRRELKTRKRTALKAEVANARAARQAEKNAKQQAQATAKSDETAAKQAARQVVEDARRARKEAKRSRKNRSVTTPAAVVPNESGPDDVKAAKKAAKQAAKTKAPKDPYRPRFAVAPLSVRVFVVATWLVATLHVFAAGFLYAVVSGRVTVGVDVENGPLLVLMGVVVANAILGIVGIVGMCKGSRLGRRVSLMVVLLGIWALPVSLVAAFALVARDSRDWAI
jgi:hypothetical protein